MKTRKGFVSNSSSSSFLIKGVNKEYIAGVIFLGLEWEQEGSSDEQWVQYTRDNRSLAIENMGGRAIPSDIPILITSTCNYKTIVLQQDDDVVVHTSWNHEWGKIFGEFLPDYSILDHTDYDNMENDEYDKLRNTRMYDPLRDVFVTLGKNDYF